MKKLFKEAHKMTRELVEKYEVNYQAQFTLVLTYLLETKEEELDKETINFIDDLKLTEQERVIVIDKLKRNNKVNKERVIRLIRDDRNVRMRLKNAELYNHTKGLAEGFTGRGKIQAKNLKFWENYGKKRIYFDMIIDGTYVDNYFLTIK